MVAFMRLESNLYHPSLYYFNACNLLMVKDGAGTFGRIGGSHLTHCMSISCEARVYALAHNLCSLEMFLCVALGADPFIGLVSGFCFGTLRREAQHFRREQHVVKVAEHLRITSIVFIIFPDVIKTRLFISMPETTRSCHLAPPLLC